LQLAKEFGQLTAIDVSSDMIERARGVAPDAVRFHQVNGPVIPVADGEADAVFSVHVMQHLENMRVLEAYIREIARVLRADGTAMVHIPLQGSPPPNPLRRLQQELTLRNSRRSLRTGQGHTTMRTNDYWLNEVWMAFTRAGFRDIELRLIPVRSNGYGHQFWLARAR
jgi:ubiquinone/menaquinone biosynthesis C-methylase UbiE